MILHGIEYQHPTSLNMRILADHVTYSFLAFMKSIFHFCLGCYCEGYSQNGRSNLSSFTWPMGSRRLVGPVWSLQTDIYGTSCQLVWQNWQLTIHLNLDFLTFLEILKMYFSEASFNFWLLLMTGSVCLCVHVSICPCVNPEHVHMISCDPLKPGSSYLDQWCKALWLRPPLFWGDWPWHLGSNLT